jgi:hypothetical protein
MHERQTLGLRNPSSCYGRAFKWCDPPGADNGEPDALTDAPLESAVPRLAGLFSLRRVGFPNVLARGRTASPEEAVPRVGGMFVFPTF